MNENWISPKIIIGNTAKGNYYYSRPHIVAEIWEELEKGNNALIAAPRRVGKSSVMVYMSENCPDGYKCVFENIQGIRSEGEFYKRFYELIIKCLKPFQKKLAWLTEILNKHKIEEISIEGNIKIKEAAINYREEIDRLIPKLNNRELKIVLFIDELPEVLHSLTKANKKEEAAAILKNIRRWRQDDQFKNLRLVLAGSIGIHYVVKSIEGRTTDINDFNPIKFEPLTQAEAVVYIGWATDNNASVQYDPVQTTYLLSKIQYFVPYFINLMLDEINKNARKVDNPIITEAAIDHAYESVIKSTDHFKDWKNRIFDYMPADEAAFVNEILIHTAHRETISQQKIHDIAGKHNKIMERMDLIDGLEKDGYITEHGNVYLFQSPFLKAFWKRNNPIYHD